MTHNILIASNGKKNDNEKKYEIPFSLVENMKWDTSKIVMALMAVLWKKNNVSEFCCDNLMLSVNSQTICNDLACQINKAKELDTEFSVSSIRAFTIDFMDDKVEITSCVEEMNDISERDMIDMIENLINQMNDDITFGDLVFVNEEKRKQLVYDFNSTDTEFSKEKLLNNLFEQKAKKVPERIAVTDGKVNLSYSKLDSLVEQFAGYLQSQNVKEDDKVIIYMSHSFEMIVSVLAVLRCGAVYVPIHVATPFDRMKSIVDIVDCRVVLTNIIDNKIEQVSEFDGIDVVYTGNEICGIESVRVFDILKKSSVVYEMRSIIRDTKELAYIIFTSGSTGVPKGVKINHRAAVNILEWMKKTFGICEEDKLLFVTSLSFDLSVYDIFGTLGSGATIRICSDEDLANPQTLARIVYEEKITVWDSTPAALQQVLLCIENEESFDKDNSSMRHIFMSGDWIPVDMPERLKNVFRNAQIVSLGGATEATIWSNFYLIEDVDPTWKSIPYGKPIQNARYYVLDDKLNPLPEYFPGELFIGGLCLADGYAGNKELTDEKFLPSPFVEGERIYATGDLAYMAYDDNIHLLGRIDNQVKVRGYRIELDEIKTVINHLDFVENVAVIATGNSSEDKSINAYILPKNEEKYVDNKEVLANWETVFDYNYEQKESFDRFVGWNSSNSGEQIPRDEMEEWLEDTAKMIDQYLPQRVLEIGCGTGMIMFALIDKIEKYVGSDISSNVIDYLKNQLKENANQSNKIDLFCTCADDFDNYEPNFFDTVIMNSVVQYFPSYDYLQDVIGKCINVINEKGGRIIIGDVINYDQKECFIENHMEMEDKELYISPDVFRYLPRLFPEIRCVEVLYKNGLYVNELSKYRYDVILHVNETMEKLDVDDCIYTKWDSVEKELEIEDKCVFIDEVPVSVMHGTQRGHDTKMRRILSHKNRCNIKCILPTGRDMQKAAILLNSSNRILEKYNDEISELNVERSVSHPTKSSAKMELLNRVVDYLEQQLPPYMIPTSIYFVNEIPLTSNGKIDTKKLIMDNSTKERMQYVGPKTEEQRVLQNIFQNVLNLSNVGICDKFSDIGGQSIRATIISIEIRRRLRYDIPVKMILELQTIEAISEYLTTLASGDENEAMESCDASETIATSNQRRMHVAQNLSEDNISYNIVDVTCVRGDFDAKRFKSALSKCIRKYTSLRTSFHTVGNQLWQRYEETMDAPVVERNIRTDEISEFIKRENVPFDLENGPLWKLLLLKTSDNEYIIAFIFHHIIMDGISLGNLKRNLERFYDGRETEETEHRNMLDYSLWENAYINSESFNDDKKYWKARLAEVPEVVSFKTDRIRKNFLSFEGDNAFFKIPAHICEGMQKLASEMKTTVFTILSAALNIQLYKNTGCNDIVVGTVAANRNHGDTVDIVGMIVNTVPIRVKMSSEESVANLIRKIEELAREDIAHQQFPYEYFNSECVENLGGDSFSAFIAYQNIDNMPLKFSGCESERVKYRNVVSKFDVSYIFNEEKSGLELEVEYRTSLYDYSSIERFVKQFLFVLETMLLRKDIKIKDVTLAPYAEIRKIYDSLNATDSNDSGKKNLNQTILDSFIENSNAIALVQNERKMTYGQMMDCISKVSNYILRLGLEDNSVIAVMMRPSMEQIFTQLAILLSGYTFLCLDLNYPAERNQYILEDSSTKLILYCSERPEIRFDEQSVIDIKDVLDQTEEAEGLNQIDVDDGRNAYVVYTSGSTGKPKGVMIQRKSLLNLIYWYVKYYEMNSSDNTTKYAGVAFDASIMEIYPALLAGASIHVIPDDIKLELPKLNDYFKKNKITISYLPTQLCEEFMKLSNNSLRCLLTGGDALRSFTKGSYEVYNNYGPTENTVITTAYHVTEQVDNIPIGRPIKNSKVYVVDNDNNLLPKNVAGELLIAGLGLAKGYINDKENEGRFQHIPNLCEDRVYRTGDIVYLDDEGEIVFLHRKDNQIQIRGFRVEIGEVESKIGELDAIESCVVIVKGEEKNKSLYCYYTSSTELAENEIKEGLMEKLPYYMIPARFIKLDAMPLTPNGKIDRKSLKTYRDERKNGVRTLTTSNEELIASIWSDLLKVNYEDMSKDSMFFELGGDSISAIQFISTLRRYQYNAEVLDVYKNPTIEGIAHAMTAYSQANEETSSVGALPFLPIQKWFLRKVENKNDYFNMAELYRSDVSFDLAFLERAVRLIVEKHDVLRTKIHFDGTTWNQEIQPDADKSFIVKEYTCQEEKVTEVASEIQKSLSMESDENIAVVSIHAENNEFLFVCIKHMLIDAFSFTFVVQDIVTAYDKMTNNVLDIEVERTVSINSWCQKTYDERDVKRASDYWQEACAHFPQNDKGREKTGKMETIHFVFSDESSKLLYNTSKNEILCSYDDIIMCAVSRSYKKVLNEDKIVVNRERHGRDNPYFSMDISRTAGWFTVKYPVLLEYKTNIGENIDGIMRNSELAMEYSWFFDLLVNGDEHSAIEYEPKISINYLGKHSDEEFMNFLHYSKHDVGRIISDDFGTLFDLDFNVKFVNGQLCVKVNYNSGEYSKTNIIDLLEAIENETRNIVSFCCESTRIDASVLENVVPVTDVFYLDCYTQAVLPVINFLGRNLEELFCQYVFNYEKSNDGLIPITVKNNCRESVNDTLKKLGIDVISKKVCYDLLYDVKTSILAEMPVVLNIDCFYSPLRYDTYNKVHLPHDLLIIGFDDKDKNFIIIEHPNVNSSNFTVCKMSYDDMGKAYYEGIKNFAGTKNDTFWKFYAKSDKRIVDCKAVYLTHWNDCDKSIIDGIDALTSMERKNDVNEIISSISLSDIDEMIAQVNQIINMKKAEFYGVKRIFMDGKFEGLADEVILAWERIRKKCYEYKLKLTNNKLNSWEIDEMLKIVWEKEKQLIAHQKETEV